MKETTMKTILIAAMLVCAVSKGQTVDEYKQFVEKWEGRRLSQYIDSTGNHTIGVGHKFAKGETLRAKITNRQADLYLDTDIKSAIATAQRLVPTFTNHPPMVKLILVDLSFNLGERGLSEFKKMLPACNSYNYKTMAAELKDSPWFIQTGRRGLHHVGKIEQIAREK